jgi:HPr kinase/phosphorylase
MAPKFESQLSSDAVERRLHATCIAIGEQGVLLRGASGAGKSDLALRLINCTAVFAPCGAPARAGGRPIRLVADDQVIVWNRDGMLMARPPEVLAGKLEVRGLGVVDLDYLREIAIALVVDLVPADSIERMPELKQTIEINGVVVPLLALAPFQASAPEKLALALAVLTPIS